MAKRAVPKRGAVLEQTDAKISPGSAADGSVDRIRDILFGVQMRDYEGRFAALEAQLEEKIQKLSSDFQTRLLEALEGEAKQRASSCSALSHELKEMRSSLERRIEEAERNTADAISEAERALSETLQQKTEGLQQGKAGRKELSGLLEEVARRLLD